MFLWVYKFENCLLGSSYHPTSAQEAPKSNSNFGEKRSILLWSYKQTLQNYFSVFVLTKFPLTVHLGGAGKSWNQVIQQEHSLKFCPFHVPVLPRLCIVMLAALSTGIYSFHFPTILHIQFAHIAILDLMYIYHTIKQSFFSNFF